MEQTAREVILGQMAKAEEKLSAAKSLARGKFPDDAISRAYYAIFHAASAVLLAEQITVRSHSALKNMFGLHLVKKGKIDARYGRILGELQDEREDGDYDIVTSFGKYDATVAIHKAEKFLKAMKQYLIKQHHVKF